MLEAAWVDWKIFFAHHTLAHQIIHWNTLVLQYNQVLLERAQDNLCAADQFVGNVQLVIWNSGQTVVFECVMQEDYAAQGSINSVDPGK